MACMAIGCKSRMGVMTENNTKISFHRFPKDPELRKKWLKNLGRENWCPSQYVRLCSLHFHESCYRQGYQIRILHSDAVPTIFHNTQQNIQNAVRRSRPSRPDNYGASTSKLNNKSEICELKGTINQQIKVIQKLESTVTRYKNLAAKRARIVKNLQQKTYLQRKKSANMSAIISDLKNKLKLDEDKLDILSNISKKNCDFLKRYLLKEKSISISREYSPELKKFAITLHFLSPKGYEYVRQHFNTILPHSKTISRWYSGIDCGPGFTAEAFDVIKNRVKNSKKILYCALTFDEMAIRKNLEWDGKKYRGFITIGNNEDGPEMTLAKEVLTFMLTCINDYWKIPVGYFFIDGISGTQKCTLLKQCLNFLTETGINIVSVTFDGATMNAAMAKSLGCNLSPGSLKTFFEHGNKKIALIYDPCHNLKLVRNTLGDKLKLIDGEDRVISWHYFELLENLQSHEGLHAANKLRTAHIYFQKQKMKVKLASQLLSASVADALQFCNNLQIPEFEGCEGTVEFIRNFNDLFDILNSRNLASQGFKKPLCETNYLAVKGKLLEIETYIQKLKYSNGEKVINSKRKTGFVGFLVCIKSIIFIYETIILHSGHNFYFLPTYKLSQDHIEIFFGAIRSLGGFNNNPSARLFETAYKKLLIHSEFKPSRTGNCLPLEDIRILQTRGPNNINILNSNNLKTRILLEDKDDELRCPPDILEEHNYVCNFNCITEYSYETIGYIAGFIVKRVEKKIYCEPCLKILRDDSTKNLLINSKNRGGLIKPSKDITVICVQAERNFRYYLNTLGVQSIGNHQNLLKMTNSVFKTIKSEVFKKIDQHVTDQYIIDNHKHLLIKLIIDLYFKIRIHHECNKHKSTSKDSIRTFFNKIVLFKGQ